MRDALWLCEFLYLNYGIYRSASERVIDYFLTKPLFKGQDDAEREKFEKIMKVDFGIMERLREIGYDIQCYGNSFSSMHLPFTRALRCVECRSERNMIGRDRRILNFEFRQADFSFYVNCHKCKTVRRHMVHDYAKRDARHIKLVRWDPKKITIEMNEQTQDCRYWLEIDAQVQAKVRRGDPFTMATLPWSFVAAIKNNQRYLFDNDWFLHLREASLAGLHLGGWGIPSVLSAFKNFFRLQVLYRYDETLKMDYIVPLRILSPRDLKVPVGNEFMQLNAGSQMNHAKAAVQRHRIDGADWSFFPFPVDYQAVGGEGAQLDQSTRDTIQAEEDRLLNTRKIPPELYRGNLTLQNAPVGLRLFESSHSPLILLLNRAMQWMSNGVGRFMNSGDHEAQLESVKITDNLDDKAWRLQAAMTGAISKETGFGPLGIDAREEERRVIQEQLRQQKEQQKAQQDVQMEMMSLDAQGSQSQGQDPRGGMTPPDMEAQADETARQLLDPTLPEVNRRQQLSALRTSNPTMHAVVIKKMDQYRNQAGTAGQAAGLQAMGIGGQSKQGDLEQLQRLAAIKKAAGIFFPQHRNGHRLGLSGDDQSLSLKLALREGVMPILLKQSDLDQEPFDLMANVVDMLDQIGFEFE